MVELTEHLHPMVVHFPIALFIMALFFELLSVFTRHEGLHKTALHLFVTAALITPLVVRTGLDEAARLNLKHPVLNEHREYAEWLMWVSLAALPLLWAVNRKCQKCFRAVFILVLISTAVLVTLTGHEGGKMVFEYGVGTE